MKKFFWRYQALVSLRVFPTSPANLWSEPVNLSNPKVLVSAIARPKSSGVMVKVVELRRKSLRL